MFSFSMRKPPSLKTRRRVRRLRAEPLENRRVLAGGIDVCLPAAEADHGDVPAEESPAPRLGPELRRHSSRSIVRPFRIRGGGGTEGLPLVEGWTSNFESSGRATGLGRFTGSGTFTLGTLHTHETTGAVTGTFQGEFVFTAANGDKLATTFGDDFSGVFTGQATPDGVVVNVEFDAFFRPDPENSTGRFKRAVGGGWRMIANADSVSLGDTGDGFTDPFDYTWSGKGKLRFAKGGR